MRLTHCIGIERVLIPHRAKWHDGVEKMHFAVKYK